MSKKLSLEQKIANQKARLAKLESLKSKNVANNTAEPSKEKIKVGDRVMVIDPTGNLTKNKIYTVTNVDKFYDDISVINDAGNNIAYFAYRFKLVSKEEEKKPITVKPNDYVVCIDQNGGGFVFGNVYLCDSRTIPDHVGVEKDSNGKQNGWSSHFFRFATNDEIYNYLVKQANERGIKVGVMVKDEIDSNFRFKIESFQLITERKINDQSIRVANYYDKINRPFLACRCPVFQMPVDECEVVDEKKELFDRLVKDADSKGIRVGSKVKCIGEVCKIKELILIDKDNYSAFSYATREYWLDAKSPFLSAAFSTFNLPIDKIKLYDEEKEKAEKRKLLSDKMIKEANDKGFKIGAKIITNDNYTFSIEDILFVDESNYNTKSISVRDHYEKNKVSFLAIVFGAGCIVPIDNVELYKAEEISITIGDGYDNKYIAKFDDINKVVMFGCANIDYHIFIELSKLFGDFSGNRHIENVKIGKGIFTVELIRKIANKIIGDNKRPDMKDIAKVENPKARYFARRGPNNRPLPFSNCRYWMYISDSKGYNIKFDGTKMECNMVLDPKQSFYLELTKEEADALPNYNYDNIYPEPSTYYIACNLTGKPTQFSTTGYVKVENGVATRIYTDGKLPEEHYND